MNNDLSHLPSCMPSPSYNGNWSWHNCTCEKIRLKISEIEKLRETAKANPAVKQILNKFTKLIEVEVDF